MIILNSIISICRVILVNVCSTLNFKPTPKPLTTRKLRRQGNKQRKQRIQRIKQKHIFFIKIPPPRFQKVQDKVEQCFYIILLRFYSKVNFHWNNAALSMPKGPFTPVMRYQGYRVTHNGWDCTEFIRRLNLNLKSVQSSFQPR